MGWGKKNCDKLVFRIFDRDCVRLKFFSALGRESRSNHGPSSIPGHSTSAFRTHLSKFNSTASLNKRNMKLTPLLDSIEALLAARFAAYELRRTERESKNEPDRQEDLDRRSLWEQIDKSLKEVDVLLILGKEVD